MKNPSLYLLQEEILQHKIQHPHEVNHLFLSLCRPWAISGGQASLAKLGYFVFKTKHFSKVPKTLLS